MLERLQAGYRFRFDALGALAPSGWVSPVPNPLADAARQAAAGARPLPSALHALYLALREEVARTLAGTGTPSLLARWRALVQERGGRVAEPPVFVCDGSLCGLARWIRAAGYEAEWRAGGGVLDRVGQALANGAVLLTSDSRALAFGAVRDHRLLALWIPSCLGHLEQLALVFGDLGLAARASRCMSCGGVPLPVEKASVRERIPPRTALWREEYFVCSGCQRLYWRGTHWARIAAALRQMRGTVTEGAGRSE